MLRFFLVKIYVFSFILIFSGCYYDVSIKKSSDKDSTSPKAASNLLVSTYSLSTSSSPVLSWDLCEDFESGVDSSSYEVQILKYSDNSIVKNWQNSNAGSSIGDLNLSVGESYYFQVRCSDLAGNSSSIVNSNIWTVPNILSISPLNAVSILTGETFNFVGISGVPNYVYSDSGSGYLNNSTGQYIVPLRVSPVSETILVNDEAGQTAQAQVNVQAFQEVKNISSSTNVTQGRSLSAFLEYGGALYATSNSTTIAGVNTSKDFVEILKSLDDGVTWSKVGVYQNKSGVDTNSSNKGFISIGSDFYFTGYSGKNNSNLHTFVAKSTDQGATWTTVYNSFSDYSSYSNGLIDTQDGAILLSFQTKSSSLNESKAFIYKCNLITWICSEKFSYISDFYASLTDFKKDNTGAIYIAGRKHFSMPAGLDAAQFLKSTDQGENWIILNDTLDGFDYPNDIVVSPDASIIGWVGGYSASFPKINISFDGGSTWSYSSLPSSGSSCWYNDSIAINSNKDLMMSCTKPLSSNTYIYRKPFGGPWALINSYTSDFRIRLTVLTMGKVLSLSNYYKVTSNFGTSWVDLTFPTGNLVVGDSYFTDILQTSTNILYSTGYLNTSSGKTGVIYKSTDSGNNWSLDYSVNPSTSNLITSIAKSPTTGILIVTDSLGYSGSTWKTFRYNGSWNLSDNYTPPSANYSFPNSVTTSSDGNFYVSGSYYRPSAFYWLVRKSIDDGLTWSDLETYQYFAGKSSQAYASLSDDNDLYVIGYGTDNGNKLHWLVRKYNGATWSVDDDDTISLTATEIQPTSILKSSDGYFYVAGYYKNNGSYYWFVKRRLSSGGIWEISDQFQLSSGFDSKAYSLAEDSLGRLYASGDAINSNLVSTSVIRMKRPGSSWITVDKEINNVSEYGGRITPYLTDRVCTTGAKINSEFQYDGILKCLSP